MFEKFVWLLSAWCHMSRNTSRQPKPYNKLQEMNQDEGFNITSTTGFQRKRMQKLRKPKDPHIHTHLSYSLNS